jgi:hypothetical protein
VAAVVVVHDGMTWLPIVIAALRAQERPPAKDRGGGYGLTGSELGVSPARV